MNTKTETVSPARNADLAVAAITQQFGAGSIQRMGSTETLNVEILPTGSLALDVALGIGGLPRGRIIEIYGPESAGKTTVCLSVLAAAQRQNGLGAIIDVEHALDPAWCRRCGVDLDQLYVAQPNSGEEALSIAEMLIRSGDFDVVVIDSVAALAPKSELEGQMGDASIGAQARLMSQAMRRLTAAISKTRCVCLFTNQLREKIGVMFGPTEFTPGGRALKFFSSVRVDIRRKEAIKTPEGAFVGNRVRVKIVKNKVAAPFVEREFDIMFSEGISRSAELIDLGLECEALERRGSSLYFQGALVAQGREAAKHHLRENPSLANDIDFEIRSRLLKHLLVPVEETRAAA